MDSINQDDCINTNNWDTVIAVDGNEIEIYVRGIKQTNIHSAKLEYWVDRMPFLLVQRTPVDVEKKINQATKGGGKHV